MYGRSTVKLRTDTRQPGPSDAFQCRFGLSRGWVLPIGWSTQGKGEVTMISFNQIIKTQIAKLPEVIAVVMGDGSGALVESTGDLDGEAAAAINAVVVGSLNTMGGQLGIGGLKRASLLGPGVTFVLTANEQEVVGIYLVPSKPLGAFEKKLDAVLQR